jgi:hypothetical protein
MIATLDYERYYMHTCENKTYYVDTFDQNSNFFLQKYQIDLLSDIFDIISIVDNNMFDIYYDNFIKPNNDDIYQCGLFNHILKSTYTIHRLVDDLLYDRINVDNNINKSINRIVIHLDRLCYFYVTNNLISEYLTYSDTEKIFYLKNLVNLLKYDDYVMC